MQATIADYIATLLAEAGVDRIWGITGDSLNGLSDSLKKQKRIHWMGTRHEESAAFAAGAQARLTGRLAVCAGSSGPGNLHLINGLYECQRSRVPVLAIASHIPSYEIGNHYFQETHPQELFKECSVYCELVANPRQLPFVLETAMRQAILKSSVAVIVISGDTLLHPMPPSALKWSMPVASKTVPPEAELARLAKWLDASKKTVLLCGAGCRDARDDVLALAEMLKAPIVFALGGKESMEWDNPCSVGMTGLIGFSSGYYAMGEAETLLILGSSFPYREFYPQKARVIQVDLRPESLGRHVQLDMGLVGDVGATIRGLLPLLRGHADDAFLVRAQKHYRNARTSLDELAAGGGSVLHPQYLTRILSEKADENTVFTCDVGTPTVWAARYLKMNGKRALIGSFNHGSMANAMPQAIGAQAIDSKRQVIALCGDGGFAMLMGDFLTIRQLGLKVKIVIYNNRSFGFVAMEMKAGGFLYDNTELDNPDFAAIANAAGILGIRVERPQELESAVTRFLDHDGPALLDVTTARQELSMPPNITLSHVEGFGLYLVRAILNGRGDEVVELARDNLWR